MRTATVKLSELSKHNPRGCISPHRYLNNCVDCDYFERCNSKITSKEQDELIDEKLTIQKELQKNIDKIVEIKQKIKEAR